MAVLLTERQLLIITSAGNIILLQIADCNAVHFREQAEYMPWLPLQITWQYAEEETLHFFSTIITSMIRWPTTGLLSPRYLQMPTAPTDKHFQELTKPMSLADII